MVEKQMNDAAPIQSIERDIALTEQDVIDGNLLNARRYAASGGYRKLLIAVFCAMLFFGLVNDPWSWSRTAIVVGSGLLFVAVIPVGLRIANEALTPRQARKSFRETASLRGAYATVTTPTALSFTRPDNHSRTAWSDFVKWTEDDQLLLLFPSSRMINILPKRYFGPGEIQQITAWIESAGVPKY